MDYIMRGLTIIEKGEYVNENKSRGKRKETTYGSYNKIGCKKTVSIEQNDYNADVKKVYRKKGFLAASLKCFKEVFNLDNNLTEKTHICDESYVARNYGYYTF